VQAAGPDPYENQSKKFQGTDVLSVTELYGNSIANEHSELRKPE